MLSLGVAEVIVNWKLPVRLPLAFPLKMKVPVCVAAEVKQPVETVKVRFVPVTTLPLLWVKDVVNAKACVPSVLVKLAVQFPVSVFALELPPPHAARIKPVARKKRIPKCFITAPERLVKRLRMQRFAIALTEKTNLQMCASDYFPAEIGAGYPKRETPSQRLSVEVSS